MMSAEVCGLYDLAQAAEPPIVRFGKMCWRSFSGREFGGAQFTQALNSTKTDGTGRPGNSTRSKSHLGMISTISVTGGGVHRHTHSTSSVPRVVHQRLADEKIIAKAFVEQHVQLCKRHVWSAGSCYRPVVFSSSCQLCERILDWNIVASLDGG